jgi:hypothetical protein
MTELMIPKNLSIPAHIQARMSQPGAMSAVSAAVSAGLSSGASVPRISIKASRFRIIEDGTELVLPDLSLDMVIVGANPGLSKTWYAKDWDQNAEPEAPDCYSMDGKRPALASTSPQSSLCASCPHNAWGSKTTANGQQVKACSDLKRLAVVAADDPSGTIYLLNVTPAALKSLSQYHKELTARSIPLEVVRTKVSFDTTASFPKLAFGFGGWLSAEDQAIIDELFDSDAVKKITGVDEVVTEEQAEAAATPAPAAKPASIKAAPKTFAQEVAEEPEEAPAPAKRGFGAKAAPAEAPAEEAPAKRGFGAKAAPAKAAKPATKEPMEVPAATGSLVDEISAMLEGMDDDDAS